MAEYKKNWREIHPNVLIPDKKKCKGVGSCGKTLPIGQFHKNNKVMFGHAYKCKACTRKHSESIGQLERRREYSRIRGTNRTQRFNSTEIELNHVWAELVDHPIVKLLRKLGLMALKSDVDYRFLSK